MMKRLWTVVLLLLLALVALPLAAQDELNTVSFNGFGFSFPASLANNVNIIQIAGDPPTLEQPGGPQPPHTLFNLYNNPPAPESAFDAPVSVRVYEVADFDDYLQYQTQFMMLQTMLLERPDLNTYELVSDDQSEPVNSLPYLPILPASQALRAQANYISTGSLSGISYITVYRQDASPFVNNEFDYTFQGLSSDGAYYVVVTANLTAPGFPAQPEAFDPDEFAANFSQYMNESITTLNQTSADAFAPNLNILDGLFFSITVPQGTAAQPTPVDPNATPIPIATDTPVAGDPSLGGLASESPWVLTQFGDPAAPQAPLEGTTITLQFTQAGAAGNAGCNSYSGSFSYNNNTVSFGPLVRTQVACAEDIMAQEDAYLDALQSAQSYTVTDGTLTINYDGGVLVFTMGEA